MGVRCRQRGSSPMRGYVRIEVENGVVDRGFTHGREHDRVGSLRDRVFDERALL